MLRWLTALWLAVLGLCAFAADGFVPIPRLEARVTDLTGTLTRDQQAQLESQLASLERDKGTQIAVVVLPTTQPESIEQFGIRLAEAWKIGRKGADDGILVIVAKNDRAVRIEVGYGLEGAIPDAVAKRIIEERITPRFREGDFFGGLQASTSALGRIVAGETLPAVRQSSSFKLDGDSSIFLLFVLAMLARGARALFGLLGAVGVAALAGALVLMVLGSWVAALMATLVVFLISFARGGGSGWHTGGRGGGGGWSSGSGGGSGGWSGGGGGFGGGGASGRW
jgi:uncharacterized protein